MNRIPSLLTPLIAACALSSGAATAQNLVNEPYRLDTGLKSRSISFENPTGQPGQGGQAKSNLSFWYEPIPSAPLPAMPDLEVRTKDIWTQPSALRPAGQPAP